MLKIHSTKISLFLMILAIVLSGNAFAQSLVKPFVSANGSWLKSANSSSDNQFQTSKIGGTVGIELNKLMRYYFGYDREFVSDFKTPSTIKNTNDLYFGVQGKYDFHKRFYAFAGASIGLQYLEDNLCYDNYCANAGPHPLYGLQLGAGWYNDLFFTQIFGTYSHTGKDMSFSGGPYFFGLGLSVGVYLTK